MQSFIYTHFITLCILIYTLLYIVAELIRNDKSTIDTLKNNAKMIGGVLGVEEAYFKDKMDEDAGQYFLEKPILNLQNINFNLIEKTILGR